MRPNRHKSCVSALALALWGSLAAAAEVKPILELNELRFAVGGEGGWLLTVSGPDGYYQRREFRGVDPTIPLFIDEATALADGSYVWELRPLDREALDRAAVRSGPFRVRSGVGILPDDAATEEVAAVQPRSSAAERAPIAAGLGDPVPPAVDHSGDFYIGPDFISGQGPGRLAFGGAIDGTETFGFASMLVEADNIRLKFNDISVTAGFPTRSWQMTMNDTSSSGAEYFRIEDLDAATQPFRIDAGAATDSLRIDQNGRVGIGTATPGTLLQVAGDATIDGDLAVLSSRAAKEAFRELDAGAVLARLDHLPVFEWSYLGSRDRHLGPVAEDFHAAFGLGRGAHAISPLDLAGVAVAAIQGLRAQVVELERRDAASRRMAERRQLEIERLLDDRRVMERRVTALESLVSELARSRVSPPAP